VRLIEVYQVVGWRLWSADKGGGWKSWLSVVGKDYVGMSCFHRIACICQSDKHMNLAVYSTSVNVVRASLSSTIHIVAVSQDSA
jgi:hypothetical protein